MAPLFTLLIERLFRVPMQVSRDTVLALLTVVLGVGLYHREALELSGVGLLAIVCNMVFAVLERLLQRHLMAQDPVDISKPGMMLLNNSCGLAPTCCCCSSTRSRPAGPRCGAASAREATR